MQPHTRTDKLLNAAEQFFRSGFNIAPSGTHRDTPGAFVFDGRVVWEVNQNRDIRTMSLETFVGGVAYALAAEEKISVDDASPENVTDLCGYIRAFIEVDYQLSPQYLENREM